MYTFAMQNRNFKPVTITIPPSELEYARTLLPYDEARTLSALIRIAIKKLPRKNEQARD